MRSLFSRTFDVLYVIRGTLALDGNTSCVRNLRTLTSINMEENGDSGGVQWKAWESAFSSEPALQCILEHVLELQQKTSLMSPYTLEHQMGLLQVSYVVVHVLKKIRFWDQYFIKINLGAKSGTLY